MADKYVTILRECEASLLEHRRLLEEALAKGGQQDAPQAVMLMRTVDLGLQTPKTVELLTTEDACHALTACAATRLLIEGAVRILWACRWRPGSQNPWVRLQVYWAGEDLKWANAALVYDDTREHAKTIQTAREEVRSRKDEDGNEIIAAPGIIEMLRDIDAADRDQGLSTKAAFGRDYVYTSVYRLLCRATHGHPEALRPDVRQVYLRHARIGLVVAVWYLLQACCHVGCADPKLEITALAARLKDLMEESQ